MQIAKLLVGGSTENAIAELLHIKTKTVNSHVYNLYIKWDIHNRAQLFKIMYTSGLVNLKLEQDFKGDS